MKTYFNWYLLLFSLFSFGNRAFGLDIQAWKRDSSYQFEMQKFCGQGYVPLKRNEASDKLSKLNSDELKKARDLLDVSDESWYQMAGVYKAIEDLYGISVTLAKSEYDLNQLRSQQMLQDTYLSIFDRENVPLDSETPRNMQSYLEGALSLDKLLEGADCAISETLISCISKNPEYRLELTNEQDLTRTNELIRKRNRTMPSIQSYLDSNSTQLVLQNNILKFPGLYAAELREDAALYNLTKQFGGRKCYVYKDTLKCPLTELEQAKYGRKDVTLSKAGFDKYGIFLGNNSAERLAKLDKLKNLLEKKFDKNDPRWRMSGKTEFAKIEACNSCHNQPGFKPVLNADREFTSIDRDRAARETADKFETGAKAIGLALGVSVAIYEKGRSVPSVLAKTAGVMEVTGLIGKGIGYVVGGLDYEDRTNATGPVILPEDHPNLGANAGVSYTGPKAHDVADGQNKTSPEGATSNSPGGEGKSVENGESQKDPFAEASELCTKAEAEGHSCQQVQDDYLEENAKIREMLCIPTSKALKNTETREPSALEDSSLENFAGRYKDVEEASRIHFSEGCKTENCGGSVHETMGALDRLRAGKINVRRDCSLLIAEDDPACKQESFGDSGRGLNNSRGNSGPIPTVSGSNWDWISGRH